MQALYRVVCSAFMAYLRNDLAERIRESTRRMSLVAMSAIAAGICAAAAIACAIAALWIFTLPHLGPVGAPLVAAGALLFLAVVLLVVMRRVSRRPGRDSQSSLTPDLLITEATRQFKEHKGVILLAVLVAGLIAGSDHRKR
jgi:hypothetical protein